MKTGTGSPNAACTLTQVSTGCVAGYVCLGDLSNPAYTCRQRCDFFGSSPSCSAANQHCIFYGYCSDVQGDSAGFGQSCALGHGVPCAPTGDAYLGVCANVPGDTVCGEVCRMGVSADCPSGQTCQTVFSNFSTIGTCR